MSWLLFLQAFEKSAKRVAVPIADFDQERGRAGTLGRFFSAERCFRDYKQASVQTLKVQVLGAMGHRTNLWHLSVGVVRTVAQERAAQKGVSLFEGGENTVDPGQFKQI